MNSVMEVAPQIGRRCCSFDERAALGKFEEQQSVQQANVPRASPPRALSTLEQHTILEWLHQPAYADLSPRTVFAMLLDTGRSPR